MRFSLSDKDPGIWTIIFYFFWRKTWVADGTTGSLAKEHIQHSSSIQGPRGESLCRPTEKLTFAYSLSDVRGLKLGYLRGELGYLGKKSKIKSHQEVSLCPPWSHSLLSPIAGHSVTASNCLLWWWKLATNIAITFTFSFYLELVSREPNKKW